MTKTYDFVIIDSTSENPDDWVADVPFGDNASIGEIADAFAALDNPDATLDEASEFMREVAQAEFEAHHAQDVAIYQSGKLAAIIRTAASKTEIEEVVGVAYYRQDDAEAQFTIRPATEAEIDSIDPKNYFDGLEAASKSPTHHFQPVETFKRWEAEGAITRHRQDDVAPSLNQGMTFDASTTARLAMIRDNRAALTDTGKKDGDSDSEGMRQ